MQRAPDDRSSPSLDGALARHRDELMRFITGLIGGTSTRAHLSEDLCHDVLLKALDRGALAEMAADPGRLGGYLRAAARNRLKNHWASPRNDPSAPLEAGTPDRSAAGPAAPSSSDARVQLAELREGLGYRDEALVFLRNYVGASFETISELLELPTASAARRQHSRCVAKLKALSAQAQGNER